MDCGSQQTFTCNVTGVLAGWTISELSGISVKENTGMSAAKNNPRITTTDTNGLTNSSTITITGFTTADKGGSIRCIDLSDVSVQGMANISVGEWLFDKIHRYNIITQRYTVYYNNNNIVVCVINVYCIFHFRQSVLLCKF